LFLFVPVVSTASGSLGGLFAGLGPETLGWLLLDAAGQDRPPQLVRGLWRARRAVLVGGRLAPEQRPERGSRQAAQQAPDPSPQSPGVVPGG
jgi:hypothetical protein